MKANASTRLEELFQRYPRLASCHEAVFQATDILATSFASSGKLLVCGNGGSAADSKHIVCELMKSFCLERPIEPEFAGALVEACSDHATFLQSRLQAGLPAIALSGEEALMTAVANDTHADLVFAQQVLALGRKGDVLLALSTSGNSPNVLFAAIVARARQMKVVLLSGQTGGRIKAFADVAVCVPETECHRVQELHQPLYHALCLALEEEFFGE